MDTPKTKSIRSLEEKMEGVDKDSLRYQILQNAKDFKTSWIELGRTLYSVWRDKLYKGWGYGKFEVYSSREIGIRKQTAMKLLKSYYFLEKEEPGYLRDDYIESVPAGVVPTYESVDLLRLAKNKKILDNEDYSNFKKEVFEKGKDAAQARRDLTTLIRQRQELDPEEAHKKRKFSTVKRLIGVLKSLREEVESQKLLPAPLIREAASLIKKLEEEIL